MERYTIDPTDYWYKSALQASLYQPDKLASKERILPVVNAITIYGVGQTGELFVRELSKIQGLPVTGVLRTPDRIGELTERNPGVEFTTGINTLTSSENCPNTIIFTVSNLDAAEALQQLSDAIDSPTTIILTQNGVSIVPLAMKIFEGKPVKLIRGSLCTAVISKEDGAGVDYREDKLRIGLAPVPNYNDVTESPGLEEITGIFQQAGFKTQIFPDYEAMEFSKLIINSLGLMGVLDGTSIKDTYTNERRALNEFTGLKDRLETMERAGIGIVNLPGMPVKFLSWYMKLPMPILLLLRNQFAGILSGKRGNIPPATVRRMQEGKPTEIFHYLGPFIELGRIVKVEDPIDQAILSFAESSKPKA